MTYSRLCDQQAEVGGENLPLTMLWSLHGTIRSTAATLAADASTPGMAKRPRNVLENSRPTRAPTMRNAILFRKTRHNSPHPSQSYRKQITSGSTLLGRGVEPKAHTRHLQSAVINHGCDHDVTLRRRFMYSALKTICSSTASMRAGYSAEDQFQKGPSTHSVPQQDCLS